MIRNFEKFKEEFTEAVGPENVAYTIESLPDDEYKITFLDSKNSYILNILTGECLSDGESSGNVGGDVSGGTGEDNGNGNYLIIEDVKIATIGTINPGSTERLDAGTVFSYSGETYYAVAIANSPAYIEDFLNHSCVRINKEKGFTVPSSATVQGDLKKEGENVYVYYPWGDNSNEWGYTYPSYWLKIK